MPTTPSPKLYTEQDVKRFMRDAIEVAAKRCEQLASTCEGVMLRGDPPETEIYFKHRIETAKNLACLIRALVVSPK